MKTVTSNQQKTSVELLQLSRQGNVEAIAALMNQSLRVRGVTAKVVLKESCLKILLEADVTPIQKLLAPCVLKEVTDLNLESVVTLHVYGRKKGQANPDWTQVYSLNQIELSSHSETDSSNSLDAEAQMQQSQYKELAQQGDTDAIAAFLNQAINDENINIKVSQEDTLLKLTVETDQFLEGQSFAKRIYQELLKLELTQFETAEVYKQKTKGSNSFLLKSFTLAAKPVEAQIATETTELQAEEVSVVKPKIQFTTESATKPTKKKANINGIRRKWTVILVSVVAGFIILRLISRMVWVFTTPMGGFGAVLGLFFLWRAWYFLNPLLQQLIRGE